MNNKKINNFFLSKKNVSELYKKIIDNNNLAHIPRDGRKIIIDNLIKIMKKVFKSINIKRVNKNNYKAILKQFNDLCIDETTNVLKNERIFQSEESKVAHLKFLRDFKSNPEKKIHFMDRPEATNKQINNSFISQKNFDNSDNLDRMFKPLIKQELNSNPFNNYDYGKGGEQINDRMKNIQKMRDNEIPIQQRPRTPEYIKSKNTHEEKSNYNEYQSQMQDNNQYQQQFDNNQNQQNNNSLELNGYSDSGNFMSFNNMNNTLIPENINIDENISVQERLNKLQAEREQMNGNINNNQPTHNNQTIYNNQPSFNNQPFNNNNQSSFNNQSFNNNNQSSFNNQPLNNNNQPLNNNNNQLLNNNSEDIITNNILDNSKLIDIINELKNENNELKKNNQELLTNSDEYNNLDEIKSKIKSEFEMLSKNSTILDKRNIELNNRENNIKKIINTYKNLLNSNFIQLEVSSNNNESDYNYSFNTLNNVSSIKLLSYSLPLPRFNITNNNNTLIFIIDKQIYNNKMHNKNIDIMNEDIDFTFANILRSMLRQAPDVIMIGEIRDLETAQTTTMR